MPVHVGQSEVAALVLIGEAFVVDPEKMHQSSVKVMHMHSVLLEIVSIFISDAMAVARIHTPTGHPSSKATRVMIPTKIRFSHLALAIVGAPKFTSPNNKRVFQKTARF